MDFKTVSNRSYPAYAWHWNAEITKVGIKKQIDEMYDSGIRAFYVLAEPKAFRPTLRRTYLSPEYLSDDYFKLLAFAFEYSKKYDMEMWLYNEGGFPSGMACGQIRKNHPELAIKDLVAEQKSVKKGTKYFPESNVICSAINGKRIEAGMIFETDAEVTEYKCVDVPSLRTDIARKENTEIFLKLTHEKMLEYLGEEMGKSIRLMFDDEAHMGAWTENLEQIFFDKYGYDICDYLHVIADNRKNKPETDAEYRAVSDYVMLCGELMRNNYFLPMKRWLNKQNMLSGGHLDNDNFVDGGYRLRYGNMLETMRCYDVPGIDMVWNQIAYMKGVTDGYSFYPRIASSAANQMGHSRALSESLAVCGSQLTPEDIRYVVNYQAVRGISIFNFMAISYGRDSVMCLQFRPNFNPESPGMDCLAEINTYTARISALLQNSRPDITTALYYPFRSIGAGGAKGEMSAKAFENMGNYLETQGVSFDLIDEEFVAGAKRKDGALIGENVSYENVFVPENMFFEKEEILKKLSGLKSEIEPCIIRKSKDIQARKVVFPGGEEAYLVYNFSCKDICETVAFNSDKIPYIVDIKNGEAYFTEYLHEEGVIKLSLTLLKGEGKIVFFSNEKIEAVKLPHYGMTVEIADVKAYINREFVLGEHTEKPQNIYYKPWEKEICLGEWAKEFSGEATYIFTVPEISDSNFTLNLGEVRHFAKVYLNDKKLGEVTMSPYSIDVFGASKGDEIKIVVSNTIANACASTTYFEKQDIRDVGPYHERMVIGEKEALPGGLIGPVRLMFSSEETDKN